MYKKKFLQYWKLNLQLNRLHNWKYLIKSLWLIDYTIFFVCDAIQQPLCSCKPLGHRERVEHDKRDFRKPSRRKLESRWKNCRNAKLLNESLVEEIFDVDKTLRCFWGFQISAGAGQFKRHIKKHRKISISLLLLLQNSLESCKKYYFLLFFMVHLFLFLFPALALFKILFRSLWKLSFEVNPYIDFILACKAVAF